MRTLLFDLDGTLIDSGLDLAGAINMTRESLGLSSLPAAVIVAAVGDGMRKLVERTIPEFPERIDELLEIQKANYLAHCLDRTPLYPGVAGTLEGLKSRGYRLAVVTNKPISATEKILSGLGVRSLFGAVVGGGECDRMKPDPESLFLAAERMEVPLTPDDWMVGDNHTDLGAGRRAGIRRCFCRFGIGSPRGEPYDAAIGRFGELLQLLQ